MRLGCVGKGSGREDVLYSFPTHDRAVGSGSLPVLTKEADCATRIRRSEGRLALGLLLVVVCATLGEAKVRVLHVPWRDIGWSMLT